MGWFILAKLFSVLISLVHLGRLSDPEKDLEILLLRQKIKTGLPGPGRDHVSCAGRSASIENVTLQVTMPQIRMLPNDFP